MDISNEHTASPRERGVFITREIARRALFLSLGLVAFDAAVWFVARPLHAAGHAQSYLWPFNAISHLLDLPGLFVIRFFAGEFHLGRQPGGAFLIVAINFPVFWLLIVGITIVKASLRQAFGRSRTDESPEVISVEGAPIEAGSLSRRRFLGVASSGAFSIAASTASGAVLAHSILWEPRRLPITRQTFALPGLPASLDGLRAVQLSDIHLGPWLSTGYVRDVVDRVNALQPDLIFLTGDFVHQSKDYFAPVAAELSRLRPAIGSIGVMGNHDWWEGPEVCRDVFERAGIPFVDNSRLILTPDRRLERSAREGLCLAGVGDFWEDEVDFKRALGGVPDEMPRLLLSHNPDVAEMSEMRARQYRVDLMLSGHTHGGQIWLPGVGTPIVPSNYGQKYARGLVQGPGCPVYINRGIGVTVLPLRFGVPPEITYMEFTRISQE